MNKAFLVLAVVVLTTISSAFTTTKSVDTWFEYLPTTNSQKFYPAAYRPFGTIGNPCTKLANIVNVVAFIKVDASKEVYPNNYSIKEHRDKPMVDIINSSLQFDIKSATAPPYAEISNRVLLK